MREDIFTPEHGTRILPLRYLANYVFEPISSIFLKLYLKWGTTYKMDLSGLDLDMSGEGWNDYDKNGIPYWDYLWHEDPVTGDAWRLIKNEKKK